jgi:GTP diphosphokinase / guanosine-3',5'-bis(diphosphate) 3'-diphosphatase
MSKNIQEIDLEKERKEILNAFRGLMRNCKANRSKEDTRMIRKAFDVAVDAHKDMRRKSGEPYIYHPIAVARICAEEMSLGTTSVICALLHDTVEDTHITLEDIEELFGKKAREIIDGLTKIPEVFDENLSIQAENFRKMILTISDDLRVVMIKLADRLHNMRTLGSMRYDKRLKIASETLFLYAPLAHRLGLYNIKSELEDLGFRYKEPQIYTEIEDKLEKSKDVRNRFIRRFINPIKSTLEQEGYTFEIKARTKSISSIWKKMQTKEIPFEEIYDIFAIRIIFDSPEQDEITDAWKIYTTVTKFYQPSPDRLRDWISTPRANGYESLHTTVMSPTGKWVEVQIRSKRMDEIAEKGLAAHYRYKESKQGDTKFDRWIAEIRDLLESTEGSSALDFIDEFKLNLFADEIYVFTPKGSLRVLPNGSTTLDFAFDIHTQIGEKCLGAKVNNKLVPLSYQLKSGDQVEIITSEKQKPKEEWLKMVTSARAKQKIKIALKEERRIIGHDGREILERKLKQYNIPFTHENITFMERFYNINSTTDLFFLIAKGKVDLKRLKELEVKNNVLQIPMEKIHELGNNLNILNEINLKEDTLIIGEDFNNMDYKMSKCCNPLPGDEIFGFITLNDGIKIHRDNCPNSTQMMSKYAYRIVKARWKNQYTEEREATLKLIGHDDIGIVHQITDIISKQQKINMKAISFRAHDGIFEGIIEVLVFDKEHLEQLISKFEMVEGVKSIERYTTVNE